MLFFIKTRNVSWLNWIKSRIKWKVILYIIQFVLNKLKILFLTLNKMENVYVIKLDKATIKWNKSIHDSHTFDTYSSRFPRDKLHRFSFSRTFSLSAEEKGFRVGSYGRSTKRVRSSLTWESTRDRQKCRFFWPREQRENYVQPFNCDVCFQRLAGVPPTTKGKRNKQAFYSCHGFMNICGIKVYPRAIYIAL